MVDITPHIKGDRKLINSYGGSRFIVSGEEFTHSLLVYPGEVRSWDVPQEFAWSDALVESLFTNLNEQEIVLIGTGKIIKPLPPLLRVKFKERGVSVDVMDTGAACRTYNVLLTEERRVLAALVVV